ncbi:hypothetical protein PIROE2DRAFT_16183 [Piromyces sp. E2]|nr:hypothetical protein PIROE2DRAFT_16183 [Piromyces sp. E2]|eukprot:OUM58518.1 hypothetical protein PIROE2DRAFT_16183 [Piromyces sp. E2]
MKSNTQNGYKLTCSSNIHSLKYDIWNAFDHDSSTGWLSDSGCRKATIQITLPKSKICNYMIIYSFNCGSLTLYGSNDGEAWAILLNDSFDIQCPKNKKAWDIENDTPFIYYKFILTPLSNNSSIGVTDINLFYKYKK